MKSIIINIFTFILIFSISIRAQNSSSIDSKYLVALLYLKSNKEINKKIKKVFPYLTKKRRKYVEFKINDHIEFLPIYFFDDQLKELNVSIDSNLIFDRRSYIERYKFEAYPKPLLDKVISPCECRLKLTFSKPVGDYLVAEILDSDLNLSRNLKMGHSVQFFFKFNESGLIEYVLYAAYVYN